MNSMQSKKGIFLPVFAILFVFLMSYSLVVFFTPREDIDEEKMGKHMLNIYDAEEEAEVFLFYLKKSGEYALVHAMKESFSEGFIHEGHCEELNGRHILYSKKECVFDKNYLIPSFEKKSLEHLKTLLKDAPKNISSEKIKGNLSLNESDISFSFNSFEDISFGEDITYTIKPDVAVEFDYSFDLYDKALNGIKSNIDCLMTAPNKNDLNAEDKKEANECLEKNYRNVEKENGILLFTYDVKGLLFEKSFALNLALDLEKYQQSLLLSAS